VSSDEEKKKRTTKFDSPRLVSAFHHTMGQMDTIFSLPYQSMFGGDDREIWRRGGYISQLERIKEKDWQTSWRIYRQLGRRKQKGGGGFSS
jgi:hypothetical protein